MGVLDYRELVTPTAIFAEPDLALPGNLAGPVPLSYTPYQHFRDGIIPPASSTPFMWQNTGMAGAVAHMGAGGGRSVFWSLPLETVPEKERAAALEGVMGWLSDLGESTFATDARYAQAGESRAYTLTLRNLPRAPTASVAVSNTLPQGVLLVPGSVDPDVQIIPGDRTLNWQGQLAPGAEREISYRVTTAANLRPGTRLDNKVTIVNLDDQSSLRQVLPLWINSPNLSRSTLSSQATNGLPERTISYTLVLRNVALPAVQAVTATVYLPDSLHVLTDSLRTSGGEAILADQDVLWRGELAGGESVTTTVVLTQAVLSESWLPAGAIIEDGLIDPIILHDLRYSPPAQRILPIIASP